MSFVFAPPQQAVVPVQDETYSYFPIRRVFGIARNYAEPGAATKDTPFYFMKDCYTVVPVADGECARIPIPPQSQVLKHEIELVACLGKGGCTSNLIVQPLETIVELSRFWELQPGDMIFTGTCGGADKVFPGDHLEGGVNGVGSIKVDII